MNIKLLKKGIRVDGKYYPCWYNPSTNNTCGNATIYMRTYDRLPDGLKEEMQVENETDLMTDYIEKDRIRIPKTSKYFDLVEKLANN